MYEFRKFEHVERLEDSKLNVVDFLNGEIYIFSKLDGTSASIWADNTGVLHYGSRKREVSLEHDNADFMQIMSTNKEAEKLRNFLIKNPNLIVYGEFLGGLYGRKQIGTIRQYKKPGFWIFAVYDRESHNYLYPEIYTEILKDIYEYIDPYIIKLDHPKKEDIVKILEDDTHFNLPDNVASEGIVIYNYDYRDRFGHKVIAKLVREEYYAGKGNSPKKKAVIAREGLEQDIVEAFVTDADCAKCQQKVMVMFNMDEWVINGKVISAYLNLLFHDLIEEEMWAIIKSFRNPVIDFGVLKNNVMVKGRKYLGLI